MLVRSIIVIVLQVLTIWVLWVLVGQIQELLDRDEKRRR